jgi:hypothetical protein
MRPGIFIAATAAALLCHPTELDVSRRAHAPMVCSRGPEGQRFEVVVTTPESVAEGAIYTIRIDGVGSGKISQLGLNHLRDMTSEYLVPAGAAYVPSSARVVPGTGTENVRSGARAVHEAGVVRLVLGDKVREGTSYTPPSLEFQVRATAPAGASLPLGFIRYRVTANALVVGDVHVSCEPKPNPFVLVRTPVIDRE